MQSVREEKKSDKSRLGSRALRGWRWLWTDTDNGDLVPTVPQTEPAPKQSDSTEPQTPSVFARLAALKIVAWLGASAGGLTILLGAIGFLALNAHDVMLGIPRLGQNNQEYVSIGGLFFGRSIIFLVASFISAKSWIVLAILLVGVVVLFNIPRRLCHGRSLVIVLFGIALLIAEIYGLTRLIRPLQISNLLLNLSTDGPAREVVNALLVKDSIWLSVEYGFLVLLVLAFAIAFILLEQESQDRVALSKTRRDRTRFWHVVRVPAFILLLICIFLLPRAYGVLTISNDYPAVSIESADTPSQTRLLLREDDKVFVLYDPASQSIVTIKRDSIAQHKMYAPQHIFTASGGTK